MVRTEMQQRASEWAAAFRDNLRNGILQFWMDHGIDRQHGGMLGWLDRKGRALPPGSKSLVQQARVVWCFAAAYRFSPHPAYREVATHTLKFLRERMADTARGGFYWLVDREGIPLDSHTRPYGIGFVIYALAEYARAFIDDLARQEALALFRWLDEWNHEPVYGGYSSLSIVDRPRWMRNLAVKFLPGHKSTDGQLHLMESFTTLYQATGDERVKERLDELASLAVDRLFEPRSGYLHRNFNYRWKPWKGGYLCSYGHDMEMSWLLTQAAETLGRGSEDRIQRTSLALVEHTLKFGVDAKLGGIFYGGPASGPASERQRIWWVQAEGLIALLNAYELSGDEKYWRAFEALAHFGFEYFVDHEFGEWHERVDAAGKFSGHKAHDWKGPYHAARACMEIARRLGNRPE